MKTQISVSDCICPNCGAEETHPADAAKKVYEQRLLIRGFKVCDSKGYWWSQCLVCSGAYNKELVYNQENHNGNKGWF